ncbi:VWA domain-containing protein [Vibrio gazogenes]|uniref:Ca-activated chloride channel family protein n=1 Tax=Vibrio gazogenes DSM 21264 = NBRC 103151 TaxID=1123492 RepID=A0A1M4SZD0_VIBGA|nr:VWA domain-containing protein [Vibrio gazogenes]USP15980.1 VWA domain-containing protein [Vibrio gazogenes]SHE37535.1 Ca-activated chloride channel family protein [Vibrio gazogenes DSM 21264] [Vibrio gazogenes DSM 21264 = NBRC 103151]SJN54738.1 von Willebrand factor type A domain protein [Vibrio gazogenes]
MAHIEFIWWWMLFLLPLPLLVTKLLPPHRQPAAIQLTYLPTEGSLTKPSHWFSQLMAGAIWVALVVACARPAWFGDPITVQPKHRDLMLVVDLSYSMSQKDMKDGDDFIDRLTAVKQVLDRFIEKRQGDRLGLVLFADHAYLQTPLTFDRETVRRQLNQTVLKLIGTETAIGEGIGLATKTFIDGQAPQRVMILLSDGTNTAGVLDPIQAAQIAKKYHTVIYTVGVGAGEMVVKDFVFTRKVNTARDLDEKTLKQIAHITGGKYFRARNSQDLANIYDTINQLEPVQQASQTWRPQSEWFIYPLALALMLSFILVIVRRNHV